MDRLYFAVLKEEVRKIERFVVRCNDLFLNASDYADKYARTKKLDDLNRVIEVKRNCLRVVVEAENVCRRVGEFFVELSAFDDVKLYAETFNLLTVAQEVVRDCLDWYRKLCDETDKYVFPE